MFKRVVKYFSFMMLSAILACNLHGQDTLRLNVQDAEKLFLEKNLLLIAEQYNISASQALEIQARLWENPELSAELNAYNPTNKQAFDIGSKGQKVLAVEQLIYLGGKKRNEIELAKQNTELAKLSFGDLLRNLRYEFRSLFYSIYYDRQTLSAYDRQLKLLKTIVDAYSTQVQKGNIPMKELVRLQAVYYKLNNDKTDLQNTVLEQETNLKQLLNQTAYIVPETSDSEMSRFTIQKLSGIDSLINMSLEKRPDYLAMVAEKRANTVNLQLQRSLAVPDLRLGGSYDQRGGAFNDQVNLTMGFNLPLWNRNQGNIKYAESVLKASDIRIQQKSNEVGNEVRAAYSKLQAADSNFRSIPASFMSDFDFLNQGFISNFTKQNINLLEFVDFVESYNESINEINRIRKNRIQLFEEINHVTASELFN